MSNRLNQERESKLQPKRIQYAIDKISEAGYDIYYKDSTTIKFVYKGNGITIYPYSGWFTGKGVEDGRGLKNLLKQL